MVRALAAHSPGVGGAGAEPELGDDCVPVPDPVTEKPPPDRFCDLVLTGGVASGVVYPWAIVELARHFHFKNIGGTSVGAMAAALAAAGEYGRRCGASGDFEVLRRVPGALAETVGTNRTRLQSLFQPAPACARLFSLFVDSVRVPSAFDPAAEHFAEPSAWRKGVRMVGRVGSACRAEARRGALWGICAAAAVCLVPGSLAYLGQPLTASLQPAALSAGTAWTAWTAWTWWVAVFLGAAVPIAFIGGIVGIAVALLRDLRQGLVDNHLGLVSGGTVGGHDADDPALVAWLHEGIQRSAGFVPDHPLHAPLTFRDLWRAPAYPGAPPDSDSPNPSSQQRSINLQMVTTNVTHGRPYRLPIDDESSRLFFLEAEFRKFFPDDVMRALLRVARPYRTRTTADPSLKKGEPEFLELPGADLPIVVAARLSLSFPLLFSALPVYAIDYEMPKAQRTLKLCRFSDGGICSNFPIHLFDASAPRWPTFGMWLDKRSPYPQAGQVDGSEAVWLPKGDRRGEGRGDFWTRFEPEGRTVADQPPLLGTLFGFLLAAGISAKDWGDRSAMRMEHVRHRVARLNLRVGEGGLNIAMSRATILGMADLYGTAAGRLFVSRFVPGHEEEDGRSDRAGDTTVAWRRHQMVRLKTLVLTLRGLLNGVGNCSRSAVHSQPLVELIEQAAVASLAAGHGAHLDRLGRLPDRHDAPDAPNTPDALEEAPRLDCAEAEALKHALAAVCTLEQALVSLDQQLTNKPRPTPELRVRPPI